MCSHGGLGSCSPPTPLTVLQHRTYSRTAKGRSLGDSLRHKSSPSLAAYIQEKTGKARGKRGKGGEGGEAILPKLESRGERRPVHTYTHTHTHIHTYGEATVPCGAAHAHYQSRPSHGAKHILKSRRPTPTNGFTRNISPTKWMKQVGISSEDLSQVIFRVDSRVGCVFGARESGVGGLGGSRVTRRLCACGAGGPP